MKQLLFFISLCSLSYTTLDAQVEKKELEGAFKCSHYGNEVVIIRTDRCDTIEVSKDGTFNYSMSNSNENRMNLSVQLGNVEKTIPLVLEDRLKLSVWSEDSLSFEGKTAPECRYLNLPSKDLVKTFFKDEKGNYVDFAVFNKRLNDFINSRKAVLNETSPNFKNLHWAEVTSLCQYIFIYAKELTENNVDLKKDGAFQEYVNSFDVNSPKNMTLTPIYIMWAIEDNKELYPGKPEAARFLLYVAEHITDKRLREVVAEQYMGGRMAVGDFSEMEGALDLYRTIVSESSYLQIKKTYEQLVSTASKKSVSDFVLKDRNNNELKFSDLIGKGKWVYIDFWATWCGPCCAEIPYLDKLTKSMKDNNNIVFISISFDNNVKRWLQKLDKDKPEWAQYILLSGYDSSIAKECNIQGIPRFMLFDSEGKIADMSAPRPSDSGIMEYLNKKINTK